MGAGVVFDQRRLGGSKVGFGCVILGTAKVNWGVLGEQGREGRLFNREWEGEEWARALSSESASRGCGEILRSWLGPLVGGVSVEEHRGNRQDRRAACRSWGNAWGP